MNSFEDLENVWGSQRESSPKQPAATLIEKANADSEQIKKRFVATILILATTCLILFIYMLVYKAYSQRVLFTCSSLMILLLLIRIELEWESYKTLGKISFTSATRELVAQTEKFHTKRKQVNFILTPVIFLAYWGALYYLEPLFETYLSSRMYLYVMVSGVIFFLALAGLIIRNITQEMAILNKMKSYLSAMEN